MRLIGRLAIVIIAVAIAAWAAWYFLLQNRGVQLDLFKRDATARMQAAKPKQATGETFRATICANTPCALVEAGGLAFLVGAGEGAGEGLVAHGLMRPDLDGVLVNELDLASVEGLPRIQQLSFALARADPTPVFGPDGILTVVDGANLLLAGAGGQGARLQVGVEGEDQGLAGKIVFDSGVVTIRAFPAANGGRVYRIDARDKSLIIAGCTARSGDVLAAAKGATIATAIIAAGSAPMLEVEDMAAKAAGIALPARPACMTSDEAIQSMQEARLAAGLLAPLQPAAIGPAQRNWRDLAIGSAGMQLAPGEIGTVMDLSGEKPSIRRSNQ